MFTIKHFRCFWVGVIALAGILVPSRNLSAEAPPALGPLYQEFKLTLEPGRRTEVVAPFFSWEDVGPPGDVTSTWAAPPIFSYGFNEGTDYEFFDFLWKGVTFDRFGEEYRFQILQLFSFAGGGTQSDTNVHRFTLFPIYFQQRSSIPEKNYTALVPIYGHLQGRLFKDGAKFVLFPIYGQTRKRDVITDNYVYPIFHLRHGHGLNGWQFWPLFGREHKELTYVTNHWGEGSPVAGHDKLFVLWPIFHNQRLGLGTENPSHEQAVLPLYSYFRSPKRDSTSFPWPLGYTRTVDRERKYRETGAPWPLIVFARGAGKHTDRVWPFYSKATNTSQTSKWYLWPIYKYNGLHSPPLERERTRILFFLYSDVAAKDTENHRDLHQVDCWPLFSYRRDFDNRKRLQILALVEPFLPNNTSVERNLSPLWSLWRAEANPKTGASSQSLLFNLYRRERTPTSRKCSLLFGIFQYHSGPDGKRWRVFHVPFGKSRPEDARPAR